MADAEIYSNTNCTGTATQSQKNAVGVNTAAEPIALNAAGGARRSRKSRSGRKSRGKGRKSRRGKGRKVHKARKTRRRSSKGRAGRKSRRGGGFGQERAGFSQDAVNLYGALGRVALGLRNLDRSLDEANDRAKDASTNSVHKADAPFLATITKRISEVKEAVPAEKERITEAMHAVIKMMKGNPAPGHSASAQDTALMKAQEYYVRHKLVTPAQA